MFKLTKARIITMVKSLTFISTHSAAADIDDGPHCHDVFGPLWNIFEFDVGLKNCFEFYSCSGTTFIFYISFNSNF